MSEKKFSKKHEWVSLDGETATVGITKHATEMLGDIVFVEVPEPGKSVEKDGQAAVVESTKAASDVYSPISGEILEGNKSIREFFTKINKNHDLNLSGSGSCMFVKYNKREDIEGILKKIPSNWRFFFCKPLQYSPLMKFV